MPSRTPAFRSPAFDDLMIEVLSPADDPTGPPPKKNAPPGKNGSDIQWPLKLPPSSEPNSQTTSLLASVALPPPCYNTFICHWRCCSSVLPDMADGRLSQPPKLVGASVVPGQPVVSDAAFTAFYESLDDFAPTVRPERGHCSAAESAPQIPDGLTELYLQRCGVQSPDPRLTRLISLAAQQFVTEVAEDALACVEERDKMLVAFPCASRFFLQRGQTKAGWRFKGQGAHTLSADYRGPGAGP